MTAQKPDLSPTTRMMQLILGKWISRPIHVAAQLGIADLLAGGPMHSDELAEATDSHGPSLFRLLRALAVAGILTQPEPRLFALTPLGECLQSGALRAQALLFHSSWHDQAWAQLLHSVKTGESGFEKAFGTPAFSWLQEHPEAAELFTAATAANISTRSRAVAASYDFSASRRAIDVGGGRGALLIEILTTQPALNGVVADLPHTIEEAGQAIAEAGLGGRCQVQACDFFESVPEGGDIYILSDILHDWDDEKCQAILECCRRAMKRAGKLLVIGHVLPAGNQPSPAALLDLEMLVMGGGRERNEQEYGQLLGATGFKVTRVMALPGDLSIIEAAKNGIPSRASGR